MTWRSAEASLPRSGSYVELSRDPSKEAALDAVYWYPRNWNLVGLYWRPAAERGAATEDNNDEPFSAEKYSQNFEAVRESLNAGFKRVILGR